MEAPGSGPSTDKHTPYSTSTIPPAAGSSNKAKDWSSGELNLQLCACKSASSRMPEPNPRTSMQYPSGSSRSSRRRIRKGIGVFDGGVTDVGCDSEVAVGAGGPGTLVAAGLGVALVAVGAAVACTVVVAVGSTVATGGVVGEAVESAVTEEAGSAVDGAGGSAAHATTDQAMTASDAASNHDERTISRGSAGAIGRGLRSRTATRKPARARWRREWS